MTYPKNRKSPRARWWDYLSAGAYFIAICTKDREHYFGQVSDGVMRLSDNGCMADGLWYQIKDHFPIAVIIHDSGFV